MTLSLTKAALEKRLLAMTPTLATATENNAYSPVTNTPYQRVSHLPNDPVDHAVTLDVTEDRGIFQVSLMYPINAGRVPADTRAQAIRDQFKPPLILTEGAVKVQILKTPHIAGGFPDGDRWHVPVSISWQVFS